MKMMTGLLTLALTTKLWAAPINMSCITDYPTTSFIAQTENDIITFKLIHHNGVRYMPIWNNIITPNDISFISEAAELLADLGTDFNFKMPQKNCVVMDGMLFNCFGNSPVVEMNGHKVSMWAVYSREVTETSFAGTFNYVLTSMALDIDGKIQHVPMKYESHECTKEVYSQDLKNKLKIKNIF